MFIFIFSVGNFYSQDNPLKRLDFLIGEWNGTGSGFGNQKSTIHSEFTYIMNGNYIEVMNESKFEPTDSDPEGEHHIDKGIISFDKDRQVIVFRQFNIEGYVNQYVLDDSLSNDSLFVFETEIIENFVPGGKTRWTISKNTGDRIETVFEVLFPEREYVCYGTNFLTKEN